MTCWQSQMNNIGDSLKHVLEFGDCTDVTFTFGNFPPTISKAHKLILAMRSGVFYAMFYGPMKEKEKIIKITDIKRHIFEIMLKYIYTDKLEIESPEDLLFTFYAAHKYNIEPLMKLCREKIQPKLNGNNVCEVIEVSRLLEDELLINACERIIPQNSKAVLESPSFVKLSEETIKYLIQQNKLTITSESDLYKAILRWAKTRMIEIREESSMKITDTHKDEKLLDGGNDTQCVNPLRSLIEPFLPCIRFPSMSLEEFFKLPDLLSVFSENEIIAISMKIAKVGELPLPYWCSTDRKFN